MPLVRISRFASISITGAIVINYPHDRSFPESGRGMTNYWRIVVRNLRALKMPIKSITTFIQSLSLPQQNQQEKHSDDSSAF